MIGLLCRAAIALALTAGAARAAGPDVAAMTGGELTAFTHAMPKGGELHNHLGGAIFAETLLGWAAQDGGCIDVQALAIARACPAGPKARKAASLADDEVLRSAMIDSLSVRHPEFAGRLGHDQFFGAFGRLGGGSARDGDMLAEVMAGLARQNTFYLELMVSPDAPGAFAIARQVPWRDDLPAMRQALVAAGLETQVPVVAAALDAQEARARTVLGCGTPRPSPGCQVTVRYLVQSLRTLPPALVFAQLQLGVALMRADRRWVGLQLVAPEDNPVALADYSLHMRMLDFLTDHGRAAAIALHAGELSLDYATPADMSFHIAEAVHVAGARRIGHGVDLPHEDAAETLAAEMAAKGVLVEVNLTSNDAILGIRGKAHPYAWLRQRGVPVSLSTDDAGLLRIDLSHEYARAAGEGATYGDLKTSARNALAFSFLSGAGLWDDPGTYHRPAAACAGQIGQAAPRPGPCADLVSHSDKAREQWRHEALLRTFEASRPPPAPAPPAP
jgi:adenosine deaminase